MKDTTISKKSLKIDDSTEVTVPTSRSKAVWWAYYGDGRGNATIYGACDRRAATAQRNLLRIKGPRVAISAGPMTEPKFRAILCQRLGYLDNNIARITGGI